MWHTVTLRQLWLHDLVTDCKMFLDPLCDRQHEKVGFGEDKIILSWVWNSVICKSCEVSYLLDAFMDLLQVHETQAEICNVIFISHGEQSLSLLLYFSFKPHCSALWYFLKLKWAVPVGFSPENSADKPWQCLRTPCRCWATDEQWAKKLFVGSVSIPYRWN